MGTSLNTRRTPPDSTAYCTTERQCMQAAFYAIRSSSGGRGMIFQPFNSLSVSISALFA